MADEDILVEAIIEDFNALNDELMRELSGDGSTEILPVMEEAGYWEQINLIRERVKILVEILQGRLAHLRVSVGSNRGEKTDSEIQAEILAIKNLLGELISVWERLETLVSLIEQRQIAAAGKVNQVLTRLKGWIATLGSWLKRISGQLWNLLSSFLTPKEWKVAGKVGTGPFGLADVSIEITFGN